MNTTSFTIESVHGIKQTIVLLPNSDLQRGPEPSMGQTNSDSAPKYDDEERSRLSK